MLTVLVLARTAYCRAGERLWRPRALLGVAASGRVGQRLACRVVAACGPLRPGGVPAALPGALCGWLRITAQEISQGALRSI
jgi:hypothetical protein